MPGKSPTAMDAVLGRNVRLQRMAAGLSQEKLGQEIGVTFQQIQKYEKGANRIGAVRLCRIAEILDIPIPALFEGVSAIPAGERADASLGEFVEEPRTLRLARAFAGISDDDLRLCIVELIERIAAQQP